MSNTSLPLGERRSVQRNVEILKALANPQRFRIACLLSEKDHTVNVLARSLGMRQSIASQQLGILRMSGIVEAKRVKRGVSYRLVGSRAGTLVRWLIKGCKSATSESHPMESPRQSFSQEKETGSISAK